MSLFSVNTTGVDIGTRTVKGIKLKKKKDRICIDRYFFYDLAKSNESFPQKRDAVDRVAALVETQKLVNERVSSSVHDDQIFNFEFELPKMPKKEMKIAVAHEIENLIHMSEDELSIDYFESPGSGGMIKINAYCAKRSVIEDHAKMITSMKLRPYAIESDMLAVEALLQFNDYVEGGESYVVVDMGESHTGIGLFVDGKLRETKTASFGTGRINEQLTSNLGFTYQQAEERKIKYSFNGAPGEPDPDQSLIEDTYFEIFREVKEALEFFDERYHEVNLKKLFLMGGGCEQDEIEKVFQSFFKMETQVINPFRNLEIYEHENSDSAIAKLAPYMSTAVGLALRGLEV